MISLDNIDLEETTKNLREFYDSIVNKSIKESSNHEEVKWDDTFERFDLDFADLSISLMHMACQDVEINYSSVMSVLWKYAKEAHDLEDPTGYAMFLRQNM